MKRIKTRRTKIAQGMIGSGIVALLLGMRFELGKMQERDELRASIPQLERIYSIEKELEGLDIDKDTEQYFVLDKTKRELEAPFEVRQARAELINSQKQSYGLNLFIFAAASIAALGYAAVSHERKKLLYEFYHV